VSFEADRNERRTPCFLCSWNRRKTLFEVAQELGCNKIALGHHQDDILHTALMNLSYAGSFSTMPCYLKMQKMPLAIIRPLCMVKESLLKEWAKESEYQPLIKLCPHERASKRTEIACLFEQMEKQNPEFRANLWNALLKDGKLVEL
jgi:tRNA(Ile)-lysidine synthase TilS/MesJ